MYTWTASDAVEPRCYSDECWWKPKAANETYEQRLTIIIVYTVRQIENKRNCLLWRIVEKFIGSGKRLKVIAQAYAIVTKN